MQEIMAMVIVATIALTIYKLFELFARRKERITMVEKLSTGNLFTQNQLTPIKFPFSSEGTYESWAIRIGLLLLGIGLGVAIATIIELAIVPTSENPDYMYRVRNTITALYPALASVFGGIGLVIAYFIEKKNN